MYSLHSEKSDSCSLGPICSASLFAQFTFIAFVNRDLEFNSQLFLGGPMLGVCCLVAAASLLAGSHHDLLCS
jgi:hypothetical protein